MKFEAQKSCFKKKKKKKRIKEIILKTGSLYKSPFPDNIGLRIYLLNVGLIYIYIYMYNMYMYVYIYIYIYIYSHKWNERNIRNIYMQSWKQCAVRVINTNRNHVPKYMSCHKAIVVITGRAHCFHDCIYI